MNDMYSKILMKKVGIRKVLPHPNPALYVLLDIFQNRTIIYLVCKKLRHNTLPSTSKGGRDTPPVPGHLGGDEPTVKPT
jgi:hypothetical protein